MAYRLYAVAFFTTCSTLVASSRHARSLCWCRFRAIWGRRGASASFRGPRLRWRIMIMTIMLRRRKPAVNHDAQIRLSWPSAVKMRSVVSVEVCGIPATKPCQLAGWQRGDLAHARRSIQPSRETRSARASPILRMRAPSPLPLPSHLQGIGTIIELYLQLQRIALTALARLQNHNSEQ